MTNPKYSVRQIVYKWTGNYGGPGIVRGIASDEGQPLRYLVGHKIEGGFGEFYHVYAEGNLREVDFNVEDLPTITKEEGLKSRTGQATPDDALTLLPKPRAELVEALATAHRQVDMLMAMVITLDKSFMPSQSSLWPDIVARVKLIEKYEGTV